MRSTLTPQFTGMGCSCLATTMEGPSNPSNQVIRGVCFKIDQPAATLWFHPHPHHDTARQIYMGLAGILIVDDGSDALLGLPRTFGLDDLPIVMQDRSLGSDGSIEYDNDTLNALDIAYGARGETIIVNGVIALVVRVPRGLVRLDSSMLLTLRISSCVSTINGHFTS